MRRVSTRRMHFCMLACVNRWRSICAVATVRCCDGCARSPTASPASTTKPPSPTSTSSPTCMGEISIRPMLEPDLLAYKALRDAMLTGHPEAFTSDAETECQRDLASYRSRLAGGQGGATLFTLLALEGHRVIGALTCEREPRRKVQHIAH